MSKTIILTFCSVVRPITYTVSTFKGSSISTGVKHCLRLFSRNCEGFSASDFGALHKAPCSSRAQRRWLLRKWSERWVALDLLVKRQDHLADQRLVEPCGSTTKLKRAVRHGSVG